MERRTYPIIVLTNHADAIRRTLALLAEEGDVRAYWRGCLDATIAAIEILRDVEVDE